MTVLHAGVQRWARGDRTVLFQPLLGRGAAMHDETLERIGAGELPPPLVRRLSGLGLLDGSVGDRAAYVVVRMRGVTALTARGVLWHPVPTEPTPGGFAYTGTPLSPDGMALWCALDDHSTVDELAARRGCSASSVLAVLERWMAADVQAVQLRESAPRRIDPTLLTPLSPPRPDIGRDRVGRGTDLVDYHQHAITDGSTHFDDRETTIAHGYAIGHPALGGERYGERLARVVGPVDDDAIVVEVGCGTGELARDLSPRVGGTYLRIDLSPELLRHQGTVAPGTSGRLGDARELPLDDASVYRLISNEVLADLPSVQPDAPGVAERLERYGIAAWDHLYNLGSWQFIEEIARVLAPGGVAWVSEFGTVDAPPEETTQLDHPEVSITFGHLEQVARGVGLVPTLRPLGEWLDVDMSAQHLGRASWQAVRAWSRSRGERIPARAWTPSTLAAAMHEPMHPLHFVPVSEPGPCPLWSRFWGLRLEKPVVPDGVDDTVRPT